MLTTPGSTSAVRLPASISMNAVQAGESDYHRVPEGNRAAGEPGPRAARHDVGPVPVGDPDGGPDFLRRPGHHDRARHGLVYRAVILVDEQVFRPPDHVLRADRVFEVAYERRPGLVRFSHAAMLNAHRASGDVVPAAVGRWSQLDGRQFFRMDDASAVDLTDVPKSLFQRPR